VLMKEVKEGRESVVVQSRAQQLAVSSYSEKTVLRSTHTATTRLMTSSVVGQREEAPNTLSSRTPPQIVDISSPEDCEHEDEKKNDQGSP